MPVERRVWGGTDEELLGIYLVSRARNANLLLNVPPDRRGLIPGYYSEALGRLRRNIDNYVKYAGGK